MKMPSIACCWLIIIIFTLKHTIATEDSTWNPDILKDLLESYEAPRDTGRGPLSMLTHNDRKRQDPPEDDLLDSLTQHGIHSESPSAHFLLSLYERLRKGQDLSQAAGHNADLSDADTIRSFGNSDPPTQRSRLSVKFHVTGMTTGERTRMAELRLRPVDPEQPHHGSQIKRIKVTVRRNNRKVLTKRYRVKDTYDTREGFDIIDVTKIVRDVESELNGNMNDTTVEVSVKYKNKKRNRNRRDLEVIGPQKEVSSAILVIYSKDKQFFTDFLAQLKQLRESMTRSDLAIPERRGIISDIFPSRRRRSVKNSKSRCGREEMTVDFDLIGWGQWIVYPKKYNAFKCSGKCPLPVEESYEPTNHAVMQSLLRLKDKDAAPRPCCVPVALKPLSMLYYENSELVVRHHEDMVVDRCGCR